MDRPIVRDAEAEAVSQASRFRIRGWDSYYQNNYIFVEAEAALKPTASASLDERHR